MSKVRFRPPALGGISRTCLRYEVKRVKAANGGFTHALRCTEYEKKAGRPPCHPYKRGGGRSKGLLNRTKAECAPLKAAKLRKKGRK